MRRKHLVVTVLVALLLCVVTGCASIAKEKEIQKDLETFPEMDFLKKGEKIDSVVIQKRETDKEQKIDTVWCTITTTDSKVAYEKEVVLEYHLYEKEGWNLENVQVNSSGDWIKTPLKGIAKKDIPVLLDGKSVEVDGKEWDIEEDEVTEISIDKQETNLEEKIDKVTISVTLNGKVEKAKGKLKLKCKFDDEWSIDSMSESEKFTAEVKAECALNITDNDLIERLIEQKIHYGESKEDMGNGFSIVDSSTQQDITINKEEVSDFKIESQETREKGTYQIYDCSCSVIKPNVTYKLQAQIPYYYENSEWLPQAITITPQVDSIDIVGEWKGTYKGAGNTGNIVLNITKVDGDNVIATYSYTPEEITRYSQAGSYNVTGKIDKNTMTLKLEAGDWINKPEKTTSIEKQDITATVIINESMIKGLGHRGYVFEVTK